VWPGGVLGGTSGGFVLVFWAGSAASVAKMRWKPHIMTSIMTILHLDADPCMEPATLDEPTTVLWTLCGGTPNVTDPQVFFGGINAGMLCRLQIGYNLCMHTSSIQTLRCPVSNYKP